jgi:hypothetical protein
MVALLMAVSVVIWQNKDTLVKPLFKFLVDHASDWTRIVRAMT